MANGEQVTGNELLADIQLVFEKRRYGDQYAEKISSADLIEELKKIEESPWATYNHGHPISPRQIANQLAIYNIKSKTVRVSKYETPKGYELSQFEDAFARYLYINTAIDDQDNLSDSEIVKDGKTSGIEPITSIDKFFKPS